MENRCCCLWSGQAWAVSERPYVWVFLVSQSKIINIHKPSRVCQTGLCYERWSAHGWNQVQKIKFFLKSLLCENMLKNSLFLCDFNQAMLKSYFNSKRFCILFHEFGIFWNNEHCRRSFDKLRRSGNALSFLPFGSQEVHNFLRGTCALER